jgi:hypothetical protein
MADYYTQFSCLFDVGAENLARTQEILRNLEMDMDEQECASLGFQAEPSPESGPGALWIHSDEWGDPEHVIAFVRRCAAEFKLTGQWGFSWSYSCSKPRLDGFGGGAVVIDLEGRNEPEWIDASDFVARQAEPPMKTRWIGRKSGHLLVSSLHLSPKTRAWLDTELYDTLLRDPENRIAAAIAGGKTRYGWLAYAPEGATDGLPDDLAAILHEARDQQAEYVLFDADAQPSPHLPIYDDEALTDQASEPPPEPAS